MMLTFEWSLYFGKHFSCIWEEIKDAEALDHVYNRDSADKNSVLNIKSDKIPQNIIIYIGIYIRGLHASFC